MKLLACNGSHRGKHSNSQILLDWFVEGVRDAGECDVEQVLLVQEHKVALHAQRFAGADAVIVAFPLYFDSMPSSVMTFFEALIPMQGRADLPAMGFIVQSGFPEALHFRALERYLARLTHRLGCPYLGLIVRGGAEPFHKLPRWLLWPFRRSLARQGAHLARNGEFDADAIRRFGWPERFTGPGFLLLGRLGLIRLLNLYYDLPLGKNRMLKHHRDGPFDDGQGGDVSP